LAEGDAAKSYRFHVPDLRPLPEDRVALPASEAHHGRDVLRLRTGQEIELFDGKGTLARARVRGVTRETVSVAVERIDHLERQSPVVHLAFAVPKGKRLDWLLAKATELGAASLRAVVFQRSVAGDTSLSASKRQRWEAQCVAAAKQCGLNFLPELHDHATLGDYLQTQKGLALLGDLHPDAAVLREGLTGADNGEVHLLVGPEGGVTPAEREAAIAAGVIPVRLGRTVLRVETAAVALLAGVTALREGPLAT
jgi:16S rRNA (uracil1498-N3)-methyltransferase